MRSTEPVELPVLDDPPKDDYWAPEVNEITPTDEEIEAGNRIGQQISIVDDEDNGGL